MPVRTTLPTPKPVSIKIKFNNGNEAPVLGLGTCSPNPDQASEAVKYAIEIGYRHIDCAPIYGNEKEIGTAINAKIEDGTVKREELFIVSKLWCNSHDPNSVEKALRRTLSDLGLEYLDLYLVHWPFAFEDGENFIPKNPDGSFKLSDTDYVETWKGMEGVLQKGLTKNIGVSNFNSEQIERLLKNCKVKPVTNQIEVHPYLTQKELSKFCNEREITITAYSPLGSPGRPWAEPDEPKVLDDQKLVEISKKYNKTPAQVVIRYQIDRGHLLIPKSVTKARILENSQVFDFKLSPEDIAHVDSLNIGERHCPMSEVSASPNWPFSIPY
ncbi:aldo-keto reductase family 1 member B1 [Diachasma alloeum]|uniref:aldo-keto reductase family 1 member B1 n=1 Tax=Diachasma alloeum TaxID=454923 RepID=UPI0007381291|nr:aldo-keto reductase family 1 member B1 [Diachasma alloeum]